MFQSPDSITADSIHAAAAALYTARYGRITRLDMLSFLVFLFLSICWSSSYLFSFSVSCFLSRFMAFLFLLFISFHGYPPFFLLSCLPYLFSLFSWFSPFLLHVCAHIGAWLAFMVIGFHHFPSFFMHLFFHCSPGRKEINFT